MESAERRDRPGAASLPTPGGVYVHLPFCSAICPYCDFAVTVGGAEKRRALVDAVLEEVVRAADLAWPIDTIYFGGGTPSLHEPTEIAEIADAIRARFGALAEPHVFLEANPEDVTLERLADWIALGVRTLSLGVQSMDDSALRFLGRRHTAAEARRAIELARGAGFGTVSVDLIYGLPGQTAAAWRAEMEQAADLEPHHLSCYQLTVHRGTRFGRWHGEGRFDLPPEPTQEELFVTTFRTLEELGYEGYEVSNFACGSEHRSKHNLKYWTGIPYLGLGPSAHSFDGSMRWWNVRLTHRYIDRVVAGESAVEESEVPTPAQRVLEQVMLGLRCTRGVDFADLERRFGVSLIDRNERVLGRWVEEGLAVREGSRLRPTLRGLLLADRLPTEIRIGPEA